MVLSKAKFWKLSVYFSHQPITRHLGDDTGCRDGEGESIALDDGLVWEGKVFDRQPIDEAEVRLQLETLHCPPHGKVGGAQDIEGVDFPATSHGAGPVNGGIRSDRFK